jgi:hypothetical protein
VAYAQLGEISDAAFAIRQIHERHSEWSLGNACKLLPYENAEDVALFIESLEKAGLRR